jgi:S-formylglutathione hydrolase FrmB
VAPGLSQPAARAVLLPDGYDAAKAYPLLVLLHGANGSYRVWSEPGLGQVAKTARGFGGIIVMPEGGTGMYVDWWNAGRRDGPAWETYILDDVVPYVLAHYRIRPQRRWHALAGVSMGGLGTAYLGGRLPGFFGAIASISGVVDTHLAPGEAIVQSLVPQLVAGQLGDPEAALGPDRGFYAYGHDPVRLAANLAHTRAYMAAGNGVPTSDGEPNPTNVVADMVIEAAVVRPGSDNYARALRAAGADLTYEPHNGIHDWATARTGLRDAIAWGLFEPVDEAPTSWVNDTVATHGELWGVRYRFAKAPDRIVRFRRAGGRLSVSAAGSAVTVTIGGRCVFEIATPATVSLPRRPCRRR